jgi:hypothetical protein
VKSMFENARCHDVVKEDESKMSSIMTVTRDLSNRTDLCYCLAKAVKENRYAVDVIEKVEREIMLVVLMLEPFVLKEKDYKTNSDVRYSHFETISCLYRKVEQALNDTIEYLIEIKEEKEKAEEKEDRPKTSYGGRGHKRPQETDEPGPESMDFGPRPVTREGRDTRGGV